MRIRAQFLREALLPAGVFAAVAAVHFLWTSDPPAPAVPDSPWAALPVTQPTRLFLYLESGGHWLAWSYGISFAFAAFALRRFLSSRKAADGGFALGGATFSGLLAFFGCWLTGCCGSPMLVVYLNLFGAGFLPFAAPLVAALTTLSILAAWWWMRRAACKRAACCPAGSCDRGEKLPAQASQAR